MNKKKNNKWNEEDNVGLSALKAIVQKGDLKLGYINVFN